MGLYTGQHAEEIREDIVFRHPVVQIGAGHRQLGQIVKFWTSASHSRVDHGFRAGCVAGQSCEILLKKGRLDVSRIDLERAALLHDIGHYAFSHALEYLATPLNGIDHHIRAQMLLDDDSMRDSKGRTLADVLRLTGADPGNIKRLLNGENKAGQIISHKVLGADKLAYTEQDAINTGYFQSAPSWESLIRHLTYFNNELGMDITKSDMETLSPFSKVEATQRFFFSMYTDVYLSPLSLVYERHIQRAVEWALEVGIVEPEDLWRLSDDGLVERIAYSHSGKPLAKKARTEIDRYRTGSVYRPAVALKFDNYKLDALRGEDVYVIDRDFQVKFVDAFADPRNLTTLESKLAKSAGTDVIISVLPDADKMKPGEVALYANGTGERLGTLEGFMPKHYDRLREQADQFFAIRIHVPEEEQARVARKGQRIGDKLVELAQDYFPKAA